MLREYLTGFRKRNLEKKKKAKERYLQEVKKERADKRREVLSYIFEDILNFYNRNDKGYKR